MKHLFINSYFDAREKHIADEVDFDRMINADDKSKAYEILQDTDYGKYALEEEDLSEVFRAQRKDFRKDLERLGSKKLVDIYFLKSDITNLRILLKREVFDLQLDEELLPEGKNQKELKEAFPEVFEKTKSLSDPAELDDLLTRTFLDKLRDYGKGEKAVEEFISDYCDLLEESDSEKLVKLEKDFIVKNRQKNEGLAPVLAYFLQKWKAEKKIKAILEGKSFGFPSEKIKELVNDIRAL